MGRRENPKRAWGEKEGRRKTKNRKAESFWRFSWKRLVKRGS